ncbi:MAG: hypothetical protein ACFFDF_14165 [Candidatus Odinarchaeota archaeon]
MKVWCVFEERYDGTLDLQVIFKFKKSAEKHRCFNKKIEEWEIDEK